MHNRVKALIVAAVFATNSVSPTLNALANEIDRDTVNDEIVNTVNLEEENKGSEEEEEGSSVPEEETEDDLVPESGLETENEEPKEKTENDSVSEGNLKTENETISEETEVSSNLEQENVTEENYDISTAAVNKLEIKPNTGQFDWGYDTSNEVAVFVEFDNRNSTKTIEIELAEGMAFDRYPVVGTPIHSVEYGGTEADLAVIEKVLERPSKDKITGKYTGKLVYELKKGVQVGNIVIKVSVDRYKYYGPKEISDAIKVTVKEDNVESGLAVRNVEAVNNKKLGEKNNSLNYSGTERTAKLQPGGIGKTYSYFRNTTSGAQDDDNGIRSFTYIKNAELTMYYPEDTTFVEVNNAPSDAVCEHFPLENKVVIKMPSATINNSNISLSYKVNENAQFGTKEAPKQNTMKVEFYDGTTKELTTSIIDSVEVVDPKLEQAYIEMSVDTGHYYDYAGKSLSIGGYIYLKNKTIVDYKNQIFEYKFSNWNTRKVLLPYGMTGITNIKYKLFGDSKEYDVDDSKIAIFQNEKRLIDADALGVPEGEFFEEVIFEVENIPAGFEYSKKGRHNEFAISFGELKPGAIDGSTTISIYPKGNPSVAKPIVNQIRRESKPENIAVSSGNTSLKNEFGTDVLSSTTQKVLRAKTTFDANKGFTRKYNLSNYLEDPEIIIRMPEGFYLSKGTIKLTQEGVKKDCTIIEHTSRVDGATIYTLQTKDVKIGGFDPETLKINPGIDVEFEFNTDSTVSGNYDLNEMIFIGKKGSHIDEIYANSGILVPIDNFDLIQGDTLNGTPRALGRTKSKSFDIIKTSDLVVTTHIRENGSDIDKQPYNKDDESTAIQVSKGTLIDYILRIENNNTKAAKDFEVYIPIPKKGVYMGPEVQIGQFNWDMELEGNPKLTASDDAGNPIDTTKLFEITYGSSKLGLNSFNDIYTDDKDVIKVRAKEDIESGTIGEIKFTFKAASNVSQVEIGSLNVFNAYYRRKYDGGSIVMVEGNYVGLRLAIGQIKGIAFLDKDNDGLYKQGIDEPLSGVEVQLWDKNTNNTLDTTTTNNLGEYKFEGLDNGEYEVRINNKGGSLDITDKDARRFTKQTALSGESYKNDSDVVSTNNIDGVISVSIPTTSHLYDVNDYMNIGFIEPVTVEVKDDGNGTVSGKNSGIYKAWPFTDIEEPEKVVANTGYTFVNYTNEDTGKVFTFPSQIDSNITIKANFEKKLFKVTLNANGGNPGSTVEKTILFDGLIKESLDLLTDDEKPTRDGYSFVGWAKKQDGTEKITDTDRMEAADLTLYAVWDEAPVINIAGDLIIKEGEKIDYLKGVTVEDEEDKDLINNIIIGGQDVDNDTAGKYEVTYTVKDSAGNEVTVERVVIVDGAPVINIKGDLIIRKGSQFNLLDGVTVEDKEDINLTIEVSGDTVDVNTLGEYTVTYTVKDSAGNVTTLNRIVKVVTNDSPIIIGGGDITLKPSEIENFDPIADLEINDDHDTLEDITIDVVITDVESGQIVDKISKPATGREKRFNLLISVTDTDGNTITLNRVVRVTNYEPVIEGLNDIVIKEGETVDLMAGVTVTDMEDGDITDKVIIPTVDLSKLPVGEHDIEYTVVDIDGNLITIKRKVVVEKANKSEIEIPDVEVDEVVEENVQRPVTEGNVDNPNTGDKGVLSYLLIAMASAIGLVKNRKGKKE